MTRHEPASILPSLEGEALDHCERVSAAIRAAALGRDGWLPFDEYMRLALYAPGLGYYSAGGAKIGVDGDFVTAPELSPLFGRCVARQCAQVLRLPGCRDVLEFGAGTGALAHTVLQSLAEFGTLPDRYLILEVSADLRARAQQRLASLDPQLRSRVHWLDALPATPIGGVVLANEVADALPCKRFVVTANGYLERGVGLAPPAAGNEPPGLVEEDRAPGADLLERLRHLACAFAGEADRPGWPPGYVSELCPLLQPWIAALGAALGRGVALIIDYGLPRAEYYHPQRDRGTLRCHFRHRAHDDPLRYPGLQDITAWVDFTAVAEAASDAQLDVAGYCTQAAFLLATGIESDINAVTDQHVRLRRASEARRLLLPGEMGEVFKVMALTRGVEAPLTGFSLQDLRRTL